jgi:CelD/BcsL family acetyltransferase involved in cellulose biosynthesis
VQIQVLTTIEDFEQLESEWNELLQRSTSNRIFSTYEWQITWWQSYQAGELMIVTARNETGTLLGIAPWFIETQTHSTYTERVVRSIGCVDVTDYVDIIVDLEHISAVQQAFAHTLLEQRAYYDRINLCNIPESSPSYTHFAALLQNCGFSVNLELQEVCPIIQLPSTWDDYLESLDKKNRHELRRKLRKAEGEVENLTWDFVQQSDDFDAELRVFIDLMAKSQPAKAEFLSDPRNVDFFTKMALITHKRGWLQMSIMRIEGEPVSAYMNFDYGNTILVYNSGLDPNRYSHLSTGIVLLCHNIQHAIETKHTLFDFLRGNEVYKYRMGATDTHIYMLKAAFTAEKKEG